MVEKGGKKARRKWEERQWAEQKNSPVVVLKGPDPSSPDSFN
jgi:hypothetical protein